MCRYSGETSVLLVLLSTKIGNQREHQPRLNLGQCFVLFAEAGITLASCFIKC